MAVSTLLFSTLPLLIALVGTDSPFFFAAALEIGRVALLAAAMIVALPQAVHGRESVEGSRCGALAAGRCSYGLRRSGTTRFSRGLPVWWESPSRPRCFRRGTCCWSVIIGNLFRAEARYRAVGGGVYLAFALAAFGAGVVVMSQSGAWNAAFGDGSALDLRFALGILLAFAAAGLAAMSAYGFRWAVDFANELPSIAGRYESRSAKRSERSLELFGVFLGFAITNLIAAPFMAAVGLVRHESIVAAAPPPDLGRYSRRSRGYGGVHNLAHKQPHDRASGRETSYPTSRLRCRWALLILFGHVGDVNLPLLLMGSVIIVVANILVFFQTRAPAQTRPPQPNDM